MATISKARISILLLFLVISNLISIAFCTRLKDKKKKDENTKEKIGKNILDYTEADMQRLLEQWEDSDDDDDDKYDDDDPRKPAPKIPAFDPSKLKDDPTAFLKMSKKGKVLMLFVGVADNPTKKQTEQISSRWQTSLHNAHLQVERYIVADDRVLFLLKDGSIAWEVKDFLIMQPECKMVEFENQKFPGYRFQNTETKTEL